MLLQGIRPPEEEKEEPMSYVCARIAPPAPTRIAPLPFPFCGSSSRLPAHAQELRQRAQTSMARPSQGSYRKASANLKAASQNARKRRDEERQAALARQRKRSSTNTINYTYEQGEKAAEGTAEVGPTGAEDKQGA